MRLPMKACTHNIHTPLIGVYRLDVLFAHLATLRATVQFILVYRAPPRVQTSLRCFPATRGRPVARVQGPVDSGGGRLLPAPPFDSSREQ